MSYTRFQLNNVVLESDGDMIQLSPDPTETVISASALDSLIDVYLEEIDVTETTHEAYCHQLKPFREWWAKYGPQNEFVLDQKTLKIFYRWIVNEKKTRQGRKMRPSSIKSTLVKVKQFCRWLHRTGRLPLDISIWLPDIQVKTPHKRYLTIEQCQQVFDAVPTGPLRFRDLALVAFLLGTGARRFEACEAMWKNVEIDEATFFGHCLLEKVKGDAKGEGQGRVVVFGPGTGRLLHYHRLFLRLTGQYDAGGPIFGMSNNAARLRFDVFSKTLDFKVSSHDLRRTFSDYWWTQRAEDKRAVTALKVQMGHSLRGDITFTHYINTQNQSAVLSLLNGSYISPVEECEVDIKL